jgi:hypothetical protein
MAARLGVETNVPGMTHLWNVSQRVGGRVDCPNLPTDVELVKVLLSKALTNPKFSSAKSKVPSPPLIVNNQFDSVAGYWIFRIQDHSGHPIIDGVVSPARGISYSPTDAWVIGIINFDVFQVDKEFWRNLPQNPTISQQLRTELSR